MFQRLGILVEFLLKLYLEGSARRCGGGVVCSDIFNNVIKAEHALFLADSTHAPARIADGDRVGKIG